MRGRAGAVSLAAVTLAALPPAAPAQTEGSIVAALSGSTRAQALADAGVALVGDPGSVFANPSGIATIRRWAIEGSFESYLAGTSYTSGAFVARLGQFTWGLGLQALAFGSEPEIVPDPASGGRRGIPTGASFTAADVLGLSALVYRFKLFAVGASAKYTRQTVADWSADAWAADVGLAIAVFDIAALGAAVQNIGGDLGNGAGLPSRTRVGMTLNFTDPQGSVRALSSFEGRWTEATPAVFAMGLELGVHPSGIGVLGRIGFETPGAVGDRSPWSLGGGVVVGSLRLDYAYGDFDVLGAGTHRVGLRWKP